MSYLTEESELDEPPQNINIELRKHQLAMLKRCRVIEEINEINFGIMNDKPGTGKTYVILSLIYKNRNKGNTNIIVVPQNIYTQWSQSIEKFSSSLSYRKFINYENIISLYNNPKLLLDTDIILTTSSYYNTIATTLESLDINVSRIFFDEIDTISSLVVTKINSNFIWFVSASFDIENIGYYTNKIDKDMIDNITCKCTDNFINSNIILDAPIKKYFLCRNIYIDNILESVLSEKELSCINAMDYSLNNQEFEKNKPKNEQDVINHIIKNKKLNIDTLKYERDEAIEKIEFYNQYNDNKSRYKENFKKSLEEFDILNIFKQEILKFSFLNLLISTSEIKTLKNYIDDSVEIMYGLNDLENTLKTYLKKKSFESISSDGRIDTNIVLDLPVSKSLSTEGLIRNMKQLNIIINKMDDILLKIKDDIAEFYGIYIDFKTFLNNEIRIISDFENTLISGSNLELYTKIFKISERKIKDNERKIDLIYDRLTANSCCPICYEEFDIIDTDLIYITSECCNNKVCGKCINNWYNKDKSSCIFCNMENKTKSDLSSFQNKKTEIGALGTNIDLNSEMILENKINFEVKNYSKNLFLKNLIIRLKNEDKKIIIFSDYSNIFKYIEDICDENEVEFTDLDKGNMKDIDKALLDYKYGNAKILLSNSTMFACGMDLENSSHIIFVHKMSKEMEEQVIGRAHRFGRKNILNIVYLEYENESQLVIKKKKVENREDLVMDTDADIEFNFEEYSNEKQYYNIMENIGEIQNLEEVDLPNSQSLPNLPVDLPNLPNYPDYPIDINLDSLISSLL